MFSISNLTVGLHVTRSTLQKLVEDTSYQKHGNQIIGDLLQWSNSQQVESVEHMDAAPEGTIVYAREHYFGDATFVKHNNKWMVTELRQSCFN